MTSTKLWGTWIRNTRTDFYGYIVYARKSKNPDIPSKLWIIYPAKPVNPELKMHAAGSATVKEVKKLRRPPSKWRGMYPSRDLRT